MDSKTSSHHSVTTMLRRLVRRLLPLLTVAAAFVTVAGAITVTAAAVAPSPNARPMGGINVEPSMRPFSYLGPNPDGWWCEPPECEQASDPRTTIDRELTLARSLHVAVVRLEFPWYLMEPEPGQYDFRRSDLIVQSARAHGVTLQPVVVYSPAWAPSCPRPRPICAPNAADWAAFLTALVARYRADIHDWEMWNEPNHPSYWAATEQDYVRTILVPGYAAVKAADSSAAVILGGPSTPDLAWIGAIYALGGGNAFDVLAFHDYGGNPTANAILVEGVLRAHGQASKPLWLGEYGMREAGVDDAGQQQLMKAVLTTPSPLSVAIWYSLRDDYAMSCCPPVEQKVGLWGLVAHDDCSFKSGFDAMSVLLGGDIAPPPRCIAAAPRANSSGRVAGSKVTEPQASVSALPATSSWNPLASFLAGLVLGGTGVTSVAVLRARRRRSHGDDDPPPALHVLFPQGRDRSHR